MKQTHFLAFAIAMLSVGQLAQGADLVLARGGQSNYQIVVPEPTAAPSVTEGLQQTARLLQVALLANGAEVPVVAESKRDPNKPTIWLGETAFAREQKIETSKLKGWGYVLKVVGQDVVIAGRDHAAPGKAAQPRRPAWDRFGTAKGVVEFVQQYVGTRFLYPDLSPYQPIGNASQIDVLNSPAFEFVKTDHVVVPSDLDVSKTPLIEFNTAHPARGSFYDLAHNRFPLVDTIFGGHTYERAVPRETWAASHPEYFALIGGKRTADQPGNAQYCISNPEVQELFFQDLIDSIDRGYDGVDLGQPDGFRACQCEACDKLYGTGKDWAEKLWILHRNLAERVEQARPGKQVAMMSYIQTALPPKSFKAFPSNTRILLTGTNEEDIAPWRGHDVPGGFSSYIYNWCPNLGTRYTPMRTPLFVETQVKRLAANRIQSVYRDGPGDLYGLEGPTYYTMGRMFEDPENLHAKQLVQEFCGAAFGRSAPSMLAFYDQLYHGIELYANHLGTRDPAWTYRDTYGRRRKHLTDPLQFLGFLYSPNLLQALERDLTAAEQFADSEKVRQRLALVRREFDYLKALIKVVHLYHAFQTQPDLASRQRVLDAVDERNVFIDSLFAAPRNGPTPLAGFSFVPFPQLGHDAKHLRLAHDGYQEPFANSVMNWDTTAMRNAPLPGAKRLTVKQAAAPVTADAPLWQQADEAELSMLHSGGAKAESVTAQSKASTVSVRLLSNESHLFVRVEATAPTSDSRDCIDVLIAPVGGKDIVYRFTVGPQTESKQDAANGFNSDPLDPRYGKFDPDWNGEWQYESRVDADQQRWTALLTIPFKTLGAAAPAAGSFWRGNIGHTRITAGDQVERSLWSATRDTQVMDDRNDFGELVFEAAKAGEAKSDRDATLSRMKALHQDRKWKELIEQFGTEDFSAWPADMRDKSSEAFHLRGQIYSFLKDGMKAEADLKAALKLAPQNSAFWLTLADNYTNILQDDEQALAAYRQAFEITGKGNGWQPLTATIAIARLLTDQVRTDEALAVLKQYGDMEGMAPVWKIRMLRAYGHVYAAQGNEKESLAKFREALELESRP
jgi:tetratricopeptide (TPR) repeat protein